MQSKSLILGGGCFWCLEAVFASLKGVTHVTSGYCGGELPNPSYQVVCSGSSGHAEVVKIDYDPGLITLESLLAVFFASHDPTTLNRQGNDVGTQYRSIIFFTDDIEQRQIQSAIGIAQQLWDAPIVTQVVAGEIFYAAEQSHQNYYQNNYTQPYCQLVIAPKLDKLQVMFRKLLN